MKPNSLTKQLLSLVLFCLLLLVPSYGTCSETSNQDQYIQISRTDWNKLVENNKKLSTNLNQLEQDLNAAKIQLGVSTMDLSEAQTELIQSQIELQQLKNELEQQKKYSLQLQSELSMLRAQSQTAEDSLKKTNESLQLILSDVREDMKERQRTEKRLRNQKLAWQILAIGLGVYAASK